MDRQIYELSREAHRDDCSREAYKMYYQALEAKIAWMEQEAFAASATIERLREALRMIADGDVPRQHAVIWRRDGQLSKHDKCPHYQVMYEGCEECVALFARSALEEKSGDILG